MSFIYPNLRDRERTCIKKKVKSRSKYTCSEIPHDPVERTGLIIVTTSEIFVWILTTNWMVTFVSPIKFMAQLQLPQQ